MNTVQELTAVQLRCTLFKPTAHRSITAEARRSIGEALAIATSTGDDGLAHTARFAFAGAMSSSFVVVAAVAVLGSAVLAFVLLRDRKPEARADPSSEDDAVIAAH